MLKGSLEDIMCDQPITVGEDVSVGKVAHLLLRYRINGILVVDRKGKGKLVGIFTLEDLIKLTNKALSRGAHRINELDKMGKLPVGRFATRKVIALQKNEKVTKAVALMHKKDIHTLPVYDKKKLAGVVGLHDILNAALNYY